jgi:hypothetical protein
MNAEWRLLSLCSAMSCGIFARSSLRFVHNDIANGWEYQDMSSETIAAPVLNRRSSDDQILGLTTHVPRKTARIALDDGPHDVASATSEQMDLDFNGTDSARRERGPRVQGPGKNRTIRPKARNAQPRI